jgi:hypothetical protein
MGRPRKAKEHAAVTNAVELQEAMQRGQVPEPEPGNETAPDAKARRNGRPKAVDLPGMKGPGVEQVSDKKLDKLGDDFISIRDDKAKLAEELTAIEAKALDRMAELGITRYRFSDQEMILTPGKTHVKIKTVKSEGVEETEE